MRRLPLNADDEDHEGDDDGNDLPSSDDYDPDAKTPIGRDRVKPGYVPWPENVTGALLHKSHDQQPSFPGYVEGTHKRIVDQYNLDRTTVSKLWGVMLEVEKGMSVRDWADEKGVLLRFKEEWPEITKDIQGQA